MSVQMQRISTHKSSRSGTKTPESTIPSADIKGGRVADKPAGGVLVGATTAGHGMYTFVYNKGSVNNPRVVSETKHCSEAAANSYKDQLEIAGY